MPKTDWNPEETEAGSLGIWHALAGVVIAVLIMAGLSIANGPFPTSGFVYQQLATNPIAQRFPTDPADMLVVKRS